jgi:hypothetical protein
MARERRAGHKLTTVSSHVATSHRGRPVNRAVIESRLSGRLGPAPAPAPRGPSQVHGRPEGQQMAGADPGIRAEPTPGTATRPGTDGPRGRRPHRAAARPRAGTDGTDAALASIAKPDGNDWRALYPSYSRLYLKLFPKHGQTSQAATSMRFSREYLARAEWWPAVTWRIQTVPGDGSGPGSGVACGPDQGGRPHAREELSRGRCGAGRPADGYRGRDCQRGRAAC